MYARKPAHTCRASTRPLYAYQKKEHAPEDAIGLFDHYETESKDSDDSSEDGEVEHDVDLDDDFEIEDAEHEADIGRPMKAGAFDFLRHTRCGRTIRINKFL